MKIKKSFYIPMHATTPLILAVLSTDIFMYELCIKIAGLEMKIDNAPPFGTHLITNLASCTTFL